MDTTRSNGWLCSPGAMAASARTDPAISVRRTHKGLSATATRSCLFLSSLMCLSICASCVSRSRADEHGDPASASLEGDDGQQRRILQRPHVGCEKRWSIRGQKKAKRKHQNDPSTLCTRKKGCQLTPAARPCVCCTGSSMGVGREECSSQGSRGEGCAGGSGEEFRRVDEALPVQARRLTAVQRARLREFHI